MSRPLRINYSDAYYHVMNRGRRGDVIFPEKAYFHKFLETLEEAHHRFQLIIHAYCLMDNHYHLLVSTPEANLSRAMRHVNGVYTQRHNKLKQVDGPLFRGRFKAILVDEDSYLQQVSRYIHRNPKEAGMVDDLSNYPWSSYPVYIRKQRKKPDWLTIDQVLSSFTSQKPFFEYKRFVERGNYDDLVEFYEKERVSPILGGKQFYNKVRDKADNPQEEIIRQEVKLLRPGMLEVVRVVSAICKVSTESILVSRKGIKTVNVPRLLAMKACKELTGERLKTIALYFGVRHYGAVGSSIYRADRMIEESRKSRKMYKAIINRLDL